MLKNEAQVFGYTSRYIRIYNALSFFCYFIFVVFFDGIEVWILKKKKKKNYQNLFKENFDLIKRSFNYAFAILLGIFSIILFVFVNDYRVMDVFNSMRLSDQTDEIITEKNNQVNRESESVNWFILYAWILYFTFILNLFLA